MDVDVSMAEEVGPMGVHWSVVWAREGERLCEAAGSACSQVRIGDPLEPACQTRGQRAACLTHAFDRLALEEELAPG